MKMVKRRRLVKGLKGTAREGYGKLKKYNKRRLKMIAESFYIPKDNKLKPLGEDSHFIYDQTIGVADGVGGWAKRGVDAGEYARELMTNAVIALEDQPKGSVNPKMVLNEAFLNTEAKGSSTACVITLNDANQLQAANVGDSGFVVIRGGKIVYKSQTHQYGFNSPYQLGNTTGSPSLAEEIVVERKGGDIVVVGSDGLFDNLYGSDLENVVELCLREENMPDLLAWALAKVALQKSRERCFFSPFSKAAFDAGLQHMGGKYDDITVVVAYILPTEWL